MSTDKATEAAIREEKTMTKGWQKKDWDEFRNALLSDDLDQARPAMASLADTTSVRRRRRIAAATALRASRSGAAQEEEDTA